MATDYKCKVDKCTREPAVKLGNEWLCTKDFDKYCEEEPAILAEELPKNEKAQEVYLSELYQHDLQQIRQAQGETVVKTSMKQLTPDEFSEWRKNAEAEKLARIEAAKNVKVTTKAEKDSSEVKVAKTPRVKSEGRVDMTCTGCKKEVRTTKEWAEAHNNIYTCRPCRKSVKLEGDSQ